jgi:hypothetical protein
VGTVHQRAWWSSEGGPSSPIYNRTRKCRFEPVERSELTEVRQLGVRRGTSPPHVLAILGANAPIQAYHAMFAHSTVGAHGSSDSSVRCGSTGGGAGHSTAADRGFRNWSSTSVGFAPRVPLPPWHAYSSEPSVRCSSSGGVCLRSTGSELGFRNCSNSGSSSFSSPSTVSRRLGRDPDSVMQPVVDHAHTGVVQRVDRMHQHRMTAVRA